MSGISYKDLVNDVSNILISFLDPLKVKFLINNQELSLKEVFMKSGCMSLFLYDKQEFIDNQLLHKTIPKSKTEAFAKLHFEEEDDSYFNFKIDIVHNLFNDDLYNVENSLYQSLIYSLAYKILSDKDFIFTNNTVALDHKYDIFTKEFHKIGFKKSLELKNIKQGNV